MLYYYSKLFIFLKVWKLRFRDKIYRFLSEERESSCVVLWVIGVCVSCSG